MAAEIRTADGPAAETGDSVSLRDGVYRVRVRLAPGEHPYEVALHGISSLAEAFKIFRFFETFMRSQSVGHAATL